MCKGYLFLVVLLVACVKPCIAQASGKNSTNAQIRNICTYYDAPFMLCNKDNSSIIPDGFAYDLFVAATVSLKWAEGTNYTIQCMEKQQVIDALVSGDNATCYMAIGSLETNSEMIEKGVEFSWPFYQGGLRILTTADTRTGDIWAFFDTFTWQLWLLLIGTALLVPIVGWLFEGIVWGAERHADLNPPTYRGIEGLGSMFWHYSTFFVSFEPLDYRTWANRILAIAYGFLLVVILALYTANTAAQVAVTTVNYRVNDIADLKGRAVVTTPEFAETLRGYGLAPSVVTWRSPDAEKTVKDDLLSGAYTAAILPNAWVEYTATSDSSCTLKSVGPLINMTSYAFAFPKGTPEATIGEWNLLLTDLQGRLFIVDKLIERWVDLPSACKETGEIDDSLLQVTLAQVGGLWIILGATLAVTIIWGIYSLYQERRMKQTLEELRQAVAEGLSRKPRPKERLTRRLTLLLKSFSMKSYETSESNDSDGVSTAVSTGVTEAQQRTALASHELLTQIESLQAALTEVKAKVETSKKLYIWRSPTAMS